MLRRTGFINLLLLAVLVGIILTSFNGFASSGKISNAEGQIIVDCEPGQGISVAVTKLDWHVSPLDYRFVNQVILSLSFSPSTPKAVKIVLTLENSTGKTLFTHKFNWIANPLVCNIGKVSAAAITRVKISVISINKPGSDDEKDFFYPDSMSPDSSFPVLPPSGQLLW